MELPNTRGMSQFADGGRIASKPYVSSARYIHSLSDYCGQCKYDHKARSGERKKEILDRGERVLMQVNEL